MIKNRRSTLHTPTQDLPKQFVSQLPISKSMSKSKETDDSMTNENQFEILDADEKNQAIYPKGGTSNRFKEPTINS